jgi:Spy/CpxP family protein refolding chaperone
MQTRQIWIILLLFTATFGGGMAAGYLLRAALEPPPTPAKTQGMGMRQDGHLRERLVERLNLTPDQTDAFFQIVDEHRRVNRRRMSSVRDSMDLVLRSELNELNTRLADILTPEQLEEWRRLVRRSLR